MIFLESTSKAMADREKIKQAGKKKIHKFEYLENEESFLGQIKNIFHIFWRTIILVKNKKFMKNSGHML